MSNDQVFYQESSQRSRSGGFIVLFFIALVMGAIIYTTYESMQRGSIFLSLYFIEFVFLFLTIQQAIGRYTLILTDKGLVIKEQGLIRRKTTKIPYRIMNGCYPFHQEFMGQLKFRYKYRKLSSLDPRRVWALAYGVEEGKNVKNARVLFKAEDEFFEVLSQFIGERAKNTQEYITFYALLRQDAFKHGEDPDEYLKQIQAQNEAEEAQIEIEVEAKEK